MKKSIKITIPEPCHEDWATMTPTQKGRHCALCEKEVIDFTNYTNEQLYKTVANGGNLCGRFSEKQLDRNISLSRKEGRSWASYAASLLIPAAILATQEIKAQGEVYTTEQTDGRYTSLGISSLSRKQNKQDTLQKQTTRIIKGTVSEGFGPLPGTAIFIKGTKKGTHAKLDGTYELEVTVGDILVFKYVSHKTVEINIDKETEAIINITMESYKVKSIMMGKIAYVPDNSHTSSKGKN
ncbi:carboxypeptidase-like regulatory domain-containing protein [Dokdonia sp.]|uniref:carboxypeptidase-like regulatory domain-containing protein n=1 Tax=Dokdonia sp. TaxID=2024995 RepID=UPI003264B9B0